MNEAKQRPEGPPELVAASLCLTHILEALDAKYGGCEGQTLIDCTERVVRIIEKSAGE